LTGRATLYGTAVGGEAGALRAINILKSEADKTMAYTGCRTVDEVSTDIFWGYRGGNSLTGAWRIAQPAPSIIAPVAMDEIAMPIAAPSSQGFPGRPG